MSVMAVEQESGGTLSSSLLSLMRLPRLRLPEPSSRHKFRFILRSSLRGKGPIGPALLSATSPSTRVSGHNETVQGETNTCSSETRENSTQSTHSPVRPQNDQCENALQSNQAHPSKLRIHQSNSSGTQSASNILSEASSSGANAALVVEQRDVYAQTISPERANTQISHTSTNTSQYNDVTGPFISNDVGSPNDKRLMSFQTAQTELSDFECYSKECYVAIKLQVDYELQVQFKMLRGRLCSILKRLKLKDPEGVSLDCAMIGPRAHLAAMKPTILFMCLTQEQKKAINNALNQMDVIPPCFRYLVIIAEVRKASKISGFLSQRPLVGLMVEIGSGEIPSIVCGFSARIPIGGDKNYVRCTMGGIITVNGSVYGLTTAHGFVDARTKSGLPKEAEGQQIIKSQDLPCVALGYIASYKWADEGCIGNERLEDDMQTPENTIASQDWALVEIQHGSNFPPDYGTGWNLQGYVKTKDLNYGEVHIYCGSSGLQRGLLSGVTAAVMIGKSLFEVRSVALKHELVDGDSGSWVVQDGRLCGYIFCRVVGFPCAYMLPIEPVFEAIARTHASEQPAHVGLPSSDEINAFLQLLNQTAEANNTRPLSITQSDSLYGLELQSKTDFWSKAGSSVDRASSKATSIIDELQTGTNTAQDVTGRTSISDGFYRIEVLEKTSNSIASKNDEPQAGANTERPTDEEPQGTANAEKSTEETNSNGNDFQVSTNVEKFRTGPNSVNHHGISRTPLLSVNKRRTWRALISEQDRAWDKSYILSFDGGGVRALSSLYILRRLMLCIKDIETTLNPRALSSYHPAQFPHEVNDGSDSTADFYPCHYFDYVAGTSTGGLISIMLSRLRMDVDDTIAEFLRLSQSVFGKPRMISIRGPILYPRPKHDYRRLEAAFREILNSRLPKLKHTVGGPLFQSNPELCKTIVIAHGMREDGHEDAYLFRSYDHVKTFYVNDSSIRNPGPASTLEIGAIARATTAAPTYFKTVEIENRKLGDGGFGCDNPAWEAYNEVYDMNNSDDNAMALLVSLGAGESYVKRFPNAGGYAELFQALRAAKGLATDTHRIDELLQKITQKQKDSYFRFNADERLGKIKLDRWKLARGSRSSTADEIQRITEDYLSMEAVTAELNRVALILVENRRIRSRTSTWEERLFGIKWRCMVDNCNEGHLTQNKVEFEDHLQHYHKFGSVQDQTAELKAEYEDLISRGKVVIEGFRTG